MKTIEEAAQEFGEKPAFVEKGIEIQTMAGFISGAKFAQRWIPVEKELPENANEIILKNEKWITEYNPNGTRMGYMDNERKKLFYSAYWDENGQCYSMSEEQPTHWRPIDLKYL